MTRPVATALVGVGGFARSHLDRLLLDPISSSLKLVAAADPLLAEDHGLRRAIEAHGGLTFTSLDEMLAWEGPMEAVIISTPVPLHREMAAACLDRGVHVLLEKPPVPGLADYQDLLSHPRSGLVVVDFQRIASAAHQLIKDWISEGRLGDLRRIRLTGCWPRTDAYYRRTPWAGQLFHKRRLVFDGPATNAMAHLLHSLMSLGSTERRGFATPSELEGEYYRARPGIEGYDLVAMRGVLDSGVDFHLALTHACVRRVGFAFHIEGSRGGLVYDDDGRRVRTSWGESQDFSIETHPFHAAVYENFAEVVRQPETRPFTTLKDCHGFVSALNAGLYSSGGIRPIKDGVWREPAQDGTSVYRPGGIEQIISKISERQQLFAEAGVPWAKPCQRVRCDGLPPYSFAGTDMLAPGNA